MRPHFSELPLAVIAFFGLLVAAAIGMEIVSGLPLSSEFGPTEVLDTGFLGMLGILCLILSLCRLEVPLRGAVWLLASASLFGTAALHGVELFRGGVPRANADDYPTLAAWVLTGCALFLILRFDRPPPPAPYFLHAGYALQSLAVLADLGDGHVFTAPNLSAVLMDGSEEVCELLFLAAYCGGFTLFAVAAATSVLRGTAVSELIGRRSTTLRIHGVFWQRWIERFLLWPLQAAVLWLLMRCFLLLPVDQASALGARLMALIAPRLRAWSKVRRNLECAFPDKSTSEIAALARGIFENFGRVLAEFPHLPRFAGGDCHDRIDVIGFEHVAACRADGQPCIFVSAHLANWELIALLNRRFGIPLTAVYGPLKNPILDRMLFRQRQALGCALVPRGRAGTRFFVESLRQGTSVGLLVDRRRKDGIAVPFFGRDAMTATAPARLALKYGCPLIPVHVERLTGARFRIVFEPPLEVPAGDTEMCIASLTAEINTTIEGWIRARPEQWYCDVRRWPKEATVSR